MNLRQIFRGKRSAFVRWLLDPDGALARADEELATDERLLARLREDDARRRWGPIRIATREEDAMHAADCPIANCLSCETAARDEIETPICWPPSHRGRSGDFKTDVLDVKDWLLTGLPELWCSTDETYLCRVAAWLLDLRGQVEAGRWQV